MKRHSDESRVSFSFAIGALLVLVILLSVSAQRRLLNLGVYEGEGLVQSGKVSVNAGSVSAQPMSGFGSGWSGDAQLFWGGAQPGAVLDLTLDVATEGIYEVELHMTRAPDFGRLRVQVENKDVPQVFDGYAPMVVPSGAISLGTSDFQPGPRKLSFMIEGKNAKSTNFFAGIDFVRLTKKPVLQSNTKGADPPTGSGPITGLSVKPDPSQINESNQLPSYMDGELLTVKCSYKPFGDPGYDSVQLTISDDGKGKDSIGVSSWWYKSGSRTTSYNVNGQGLHKVKCTLLVMSEQLQQTVFAEKTVIVSVIEKKVTEAKWATAPIIVTPEQNQKISGGNILIKPYNSYQSHCADGGYFVLDWQYMESSIAGWKPLKKLSSSWKCVPDGSTKDLSGMKPGFYMVRAKETNSKYKFESEWSGWVTFEILPN